MGVKPVITGFMLNKKHDQDESSETHGQPRQIQQGQVSVLPKIPVNHQFNKMADHSIINQKGSINGSTGFFH